MSDQTARDAELVKRIREIGSKECREWGDFSKSLREYGIGSLMSLTASKRLEDNFARRGIRLRPAPEDLGSSDRRTLVHLAVVRALDRFMQKQILEGGWDPGKGASPRSYFVTACMFSFAEEYRSYCNEFDVRSRETLTGELENDLAEAPSLEAADPAFTAVIRDWIRALLPPDMDPNVKQMFLLTADGYTQPEIARTLHMTPEAVSSAMRRHRLKLRQNVRPDE